MRCLFKRVRDSVLADFHDVLDRKEMKNPIALLNQYLRDCEEEAKKVWKLIGRHHLLKEDFYREWKQAEYMAQKRKEQGEIAQKANEPTLIEMALQEQNQYEDRAARLKTAYENAKLQLEELEQKYREMNLKIKDMHTKRMEWMGRENVARITQTIDRTLQSANAGQAYSRFDEIEHYISQLESRFNHSYEQTMFDSRIAQLEKQLKNAEMTVK
jgi:lia operon protein LiaH